MAEEFAAREPDEVLNQPPRIGIYVTTTQPSLPGSITDSQSIFAWIGRAHESPVHRVNHDCLATTHR